jgi:hypothetical protein
VRHKVAKHYTLLFVSSIENPVLPAEEDGLNISLSTKPGYRTKQYFHRIDDGVAA